MKARDYQAKIHTDIESGWEDSTRQLVVEPTGCGKTIQFAMQAKERLKEGERTLIFAHRDELLDQAIAKVERVTGVRAEKEKAGELASLDAMIVVGSIQTLMSARRLERWPRDHFALVVVDETHRALAKSYQLVLNHFDEHAQVLGSDGHSSSVGQAKSGPIFSTHGCRVEAGADDPSRMVGSDYVQAVAGRD
jgi:superfamily II DNA or RNA helicase